MRPLLVLRPEPGAEATVERARQRGLEAIAIPLFVIEPVEWTVPDPSNFDALLLTSANAVRCAGEGLAGLRRLPVYAVGGATAQAARAAGLAIAGSGVAGIDLLLESIAPDLRLLHLCGEDRRAPTDAKQVVTPLVVYRAAPIAADLSSAEGGVALIHSPRAGKRFAALAEEAGLDRRSIGIAAISAAAAAAVGRGWTTVQAAPEPSDEALLALAERLCNKSRGP
jgi:uroporphyrinogen-III synthase